MKCEKILFLNCLKYNAQMVKQAAAKLEALWMEVENENQ